MLVSLRTTLPVAASATYRSIEKKLRAERNAIHLPSGLMAGPTFRSPPSSVPLITSRPVSPTPPNDASTGSYAARMEACQSLDNCFVVTPSTRLAAASTSPVRPATRSIWPTAWSP